MLVAFNLMIIGLILLIAYWWANQGFFSAILHLVCVIAAGAIAFGVWELLVVRLLLKGGGFDNYAWGSTLLLVFAVSLVVLRVAMDKLVPGNVDLPRWVNMVCGFPLGAAAGVITAGMFIIGAGLIQHKNDIMGFQGWGRGSGGRITEKNSLWLPVHTWTYEFYSLLSVTSMSPTLNDTSLRQYYPDLDRHATLIRDTWKDGSGGIAIAPDAVRVKDVFFVDDGRNSRYVVALRFESKAFDRGGPMLNISPAQVRLIGFAGAGETPPVAYPDSWSQQVGSGVGYFQFDDPSHYITSVPAAEAAEVQIEFPVGSGSNQLPQGVAPRFIQIKGTRFALPVTATGQVQTLTFAELEKRRSDLNLSGPAELPFREDAPLLGTEAVMTYSIAPVWTSTNMLPSGIKESNKWLTEGHGIFKPNPGERPPRSLTIEGIYEPPGSRIVQVDVSRRGTADIFGRIRDQAGLDARPFLVDAEGNQYTAIGFIWERSNEGTTEIVLEPVRRIRTLSDLPTLPSSGVDKLRLIFQVTSGKTVTGFYLGTVHVARLNLAVTAK